jgi:hypothetical protein
MKDIKPAAWLVSDGGSQFITTKEDELNNAIRFNWTVTPLYAIPEGCVVVPVEPTRRQINLGGKAILHNGGEGEMCEIEADAELAYKAMIKAAQEEG